MVEFEKGESCVGCPQGCIDCGRKHSSVPHMYCDDCNQEFETLYKYDGNQLCKDCLTDRVILDTPEVDPYDYL